MSITAFKHTKKVLFKQINFYYFIYSIIMQLTFLISIFSHITIAQMISTYTFSKPNYVILL